MHYLSSGGISIATRLFIYIYIYICPNVISNLKLSNIGVVCQTLPAILSVQFFSSFGNWLVDLSTLCTLCPKGSIGDVFRYADFFPMGTKDQGIFF